MYYDNYLLFKNNSNEKKCKVLIFLKNILISNQLFDTINVQVKKRLVKKLG